MHARNRFLVPVANAAQVDAGLRLLRRLRTAAVAEVLLLQVVRSRREDGPRAPSDEQDAMRARLARAREVLLDAGDRAGFEICAGDAAEEIVAATARFQPSMIVIPFRPAARLRDRVFAGVIERVVRQVDRPVIVADTDSWAAAGEEGADGIRRILLPLDGSEGSERVLPIVERLASALGSAVLLLHAIAPPDPADLSQLDEVVREARTDVGYQRLYAAQTRLERAGIDVQPLVQIQSAATCIVDVAIAAEVDLIAMASRGRSGPARWLFGSVAQHVLRQSRCPVVIMRSGTHRTDGAPPYMAGRRRPTRGPQGGTR